MQVPGGPCEYFSLAPARAGLAGVSHVGGVADHGSDWLPPELTALPMGWSRAPRLRQSVSETALAPARVAPARQVRGRSLGVRPGPELPATGAAYVDN
eukprot:7227677-Pyramimonas_sp.AAC.1